jgi:hypothetical protein
MAVAVDLANGSQLVARMTPEEMYEAFQKALDRKTLLDVKDLNGGTVAVNPFQILSFREVDDATAERLENGAHQRAAATA